jgi:hypothetical protein
MDGLMTGLANDQGFPSSLEHDLRPVRSIFSHLCQFGKSAYLVNHTVFIFDFTQFTPACYESSYYLLSLIVHWSGILIDKDGVLVAYQRNAAKSGNQRFLAITSHQRCLKALSGAVRCLDDGLEPFGYGSGGAAIFGWEPCGLRIVGRSIYTH